MIAVFEHFINARNICLVMSELIYQALSDNDRTELHFRNTTTHQLAIIGLGRDSTFENRHTDSKVLDTQCVNKAGSSFSGSKTDMKFDMSSLSCVVIVVVDTTKWVKAHLEEVSLRT